jgi:hypothetical protein
VCLNNLRQLTPMRTMTSLFAAIQVSTLSIRVRPLGCSKIGTRVIRS